MSTDNVFEFVARACRPANQVETTPHVYTAVLLRDDVSLGDLANALRFSGIVLSTDRLSGQTLIHRSPSPKDAA